MLAGTLEQGRRWGSPGFKTQHEAQQGAHPSARLEPGRVRHVSPGARPSGGVCAEERRPETTSILETLSSSRALFFVFVVV